MSEMADQRKTEAAAKEIWERFAATFPEVDAASEIGFDKPIAAIIRKHLGAERKTERQLGFEADDMKLEFIETLGKKVFRIDDVSDEAPMMQIEFFNEYGELPYQTRKEAAQAAFTAALNSLKAESVERPRTTPTIDDMCECGAVYGMHAALTCCCPKKGATPYNAWQDRKFKRAEGRGASSEARSSK